MSINQNTYSDKSNKDLPLKAETFIPHSGLMCVVDLLVEVGERMQLQLLLLTGIARLPGRMERWKRTFLLRWLLKLFQPETGIS